MIDAMTTNTEPTFSEAEEAEIERLWERSGHGTERIDIVNAFMAGMANAEKRRMLAERFSPYSHQIDVYRARIDMLIGKAKQPKLPI